VVFAVKKLIISLLAASLLMGLCACGKKTENEQTSEPALSDYGEYSYSYSSDTTAETQTEGTTAAQTTTEVQTEVITVIVTSAVQQSTSQKKVQPSKAETTTVKASSGTTSVQNANGNKSTESATSVDLSIEMPSSNGQMTVDTSPNNKFTQIVHKDRQIDTGYLIAVYSLPDTGQNYVLEFTSTTDFTADTLRRVFLIGTNGKISSVAAKSSSERENVSSMENWFCMNVLIKKMLLPAIQNQF
jgi:cobalamin biosynthesis Mg chelatase CobN